MSGSCAPESPCVLLNTPLLYNTKPLSVWNVRGEACKMLHLCSGACPPGKFTLSLVPLHFPTQVSFPSPSSHLNLSLEPFAAVTTSRSRSNCPAEQDKLSLSLSFSVPTLSLPGCSALRLKTESTQAFSKRNIPNSLQPSKPMSQRAKQPESSRACGQSLSRSPDNTFCSPIQFLGLNSSDSNKPK